MSSNTSPSPASELRLFKRAVVGAIISVTFVGLLGFVLIQAIQPEVALAGKIGLAAFIGFWGGPVFGLAGAVGWHHHKEHQLEPAAEATGDLSPPAGEQVLADAA